MGTAQSVGRQDSDANVGAGGEDLISALPDDMLVHILLKLRDAAAAARTSVLARRWRGLWALLPQLTFADGIEHHRIVSALAAHRADLRGLRIATRQASVEYLAVWLPVVARRLSGSMLLRVVWREDDADAELEPEQRGAILLPCFQRATTVILEFSFLRLVLPPSGVFARLKVLKLVGIHLYGQCSLGDALSSPRCPSLQTLSVKNARGLGNFTIHSKSLLELELLKLHDMQQLIVGAPSLRVLNIIWCFTDALNPSQPVAKISAPRLESLWWMCDFVPSSLQLGEMAHLRCLLTGIFFVYGPNSSVAYNHCCMSILQHIERLNVLSLYITYPPVIGNMEYLMEDMTRLPDVTLLILDVTANVHSFGASVFHVLRMCPRLTALSIRFPLKPSPVEAQSAFYSSGCRCDQPPNWKTEELLLDRLEEVEISGFRGTEHEVALLKRLFSWATVLKRMMIKFHGSVTESKRNRLCQLLLSFSRPEICLHAAPPGKKYARVKACGAPSW